MVSIKSLFSKLFPRRENPRIFIDANTFNPAGASRSGQVQILFARNEADGIFERVTQALRCADSVVVIDEGSTDGSPYFAAEAGAVVVLRETGQTRDAALHKARKIARQ